MRYFHSLLPASGYPRPQRLPGGTAVARRSLWDHSGQQWCPASRCSGGPQKEEAAASLSWTRQGSAAWVSKKGARKQQKSQSHPACKALDTSLAPACWNYNFHWWSEKAESSARRLAQGWCNQATEDWWAVRWWWCEQVGCWAAWQIDAQPARSTANGAGHSRAANHCCTSFHGRKCLAFETPCQINVPLNRLLSAASFKWNSSIRACAQLDRILCPLNPLVYDGNPCDSLFRLLVWLAAWGLAFSMRLETCCSATTSKWRRFARWRILVCIIYVLQLGFYASTFIVGV